MGQTEREKGGFLDVVVRSLGGLAEERERCRRVDADLTCLEWTKGGGGKGAGGHDTKDDSGFQKQEEAADG
eukprot:scaffold331_cov243-Pinguiococcus_pyrenoidosus.AAC.13